MEYKRTISEHPPRCGYSKYIPLEAMAEFENTLNKDPVIECVYESRCNCNQEFSYSNEITYKKGDVYKYKDFCWYLFENRFMLDTDDETIHWIFDNIDKLEEKAGLLEIIEEWKNE